MNETNPEVIQQQIADLEKQISDKRAELGQDVSAPYERTEVHEAVGEQIQQAQIVSPPSGINSAEVQPVQDLVNVAFTEGLSKAISQALAANNPALIDEFHDLLADELHEELLKRNLLSKAE